MEFIYNLKSCRLIRNPYHQDNFGTVLIYSIFKQSNKNVYILIFTIYVENINIAVWGEVIYNINTNKLISTNKLIQSRFSPL